MRYFHLSDINFLKIVKASFRYQFQFVYQLQQHSRSGKQKAHSVGIVMKIYLQICWGRLQQLGTVNSEKGLLRSPSFKEQREETVLWEPSEM